MVIIILERNGIDDMTPIARWEDGEWLEGDYLTYRFLTDEVYQQYDEAMMLDEFNGPDLFATTEEAYRGDDQ